jgi:hypothetical protein
MIRNYLVVAWRNLARYKVYSAINITGLSSWFGGVYADRALRWA